MNDEDEKIKRYEEMILNQAKEMDKNKTSIIDDDDDDDDLDHMRNKGSIKPEKSDSNDVVQMEKSKNKKHKNEGNLKWIEKRNIDF